MWVYVRGRYSAALPSGFFPGGIMRALDLIERYVRE